MDKLALLGGKKAISDSNAHKDLCAFTKEDKAAVFNFIEDINCSTISYYGREGILREFEDELADYHSKKYCVLTNSGTNAIHSAFFGIGLEPGDEVIAPTYTFLATVSPIIALGAVPVLIDCESDTGNIDPNKVKQNITPKTKAIIVTHQWGHPVDMDAIMSIARDHNLYVVEDSSLALGATYKNRRVGSIGHVAAFSLGSMKMISGGQGGALVTSDQEIMERANLVGHFVKRSIDQVKSNYYKQFCDLGYGHNYRIHVLAIAMAKNRFSYIDKLIEKRHDRFNVLSDMLSETDILKPPPTRPGVSRGSWVGYTAQYQKKYANDLDINVFAKALQAEGLRIIKGSYHPLLHQMKFFQTWDDGFYKNRLFSPNKRIYKIGDFPVAEQHVDSQIAFPIFLDEPISLIREYGNAVKKLASNIKVLLEYQKSAMSNSNIIAA